MPERLLHGLIQKAKLDAERLMKERMFINAAGQVYKRAAITDGWKVAGLLADKRDREDFLVAQLTQEER